MTSRRKEPEIGSRFGMWVVRDHTVVNKHGMSQSVVQCACGRFAVIINANLREGKTSSCQPCSMPRVPKEKSDAPSRAKLSADNVQQIRVMLRSGISPVDIAKQFGVAACTPRAIDRGVVWGHLPWPEGLAPREKRIQLSLTYDEVVEIKKQIAARVSNKEIASAFGVSPGCVSGIKRSEKFASVPWPEGYEPRKAWER